MNLTNAKIIGYFSLPSAELAEQNPTAYTLAMAGAPAGAGCCANCGMGILHHVVVQMPDGSKHFIGTDCAQRAGDETIRSAVKSGKTSEQVAAETAKRDEWLAAYDAAKAQQEAARVARIEQFKPTLTVLANLHKADERLGGTPLSEGLTFWASLAKQISYRKISDRQAECVCKAVMGRRNKTNAAQWDELADSLTA